MNRLCSCNPFCASLDVKTRELLCEHVTETHQEPKQVQSYKSSEQLDFIAKGVLLTFVLLEDGSQEGIELIQEGDILGTHMLSNVTNYPDYHAMALTVVKKCTIPIKVIENLFRENLQFSSVLLQNISQRHARNSIHWVNMHSKKGEEKVEFIVELLKTKDVDMSIITQEDLALISGVSRITVARAMKRLNKVQ